jgi:hypothetical protein
MKKLFLGAFAMLLLGAGCLGGSRVESDWVLGFKSMDGWHMVNAYDDRDNLEDMQREFAFDAVDVVVQSTDKFVFTGDVPTNTEGYGEFVADKYIKITIERMDLRRRIPGEAEDIGNGFFKASDTEYYLELPDEKYQFLVEAEGEDLSKAETLILSAQRAEVPKEE